MNNIASLPSSPIQFQPRQESESSRASSQAPAGQGVTDVRDAQSNQGNTIESAPQQEASETALQSSVVNLNTHLQLLERGLEFVVDADRGETIIKVIDKATNELVRQIPTEQVIELAQKLEEVLPLNIFKAEA